MDVIIVAAAAILPVSTALSGSVTLFREPLDRPYAPS